MSASGRWSRGSGPTGEKVVRDCDLSDFTAWNRSEIASPVRALKTPMRFRARLVAALLVCSACSTSPAEAGAPAKQAAPATPATPSGAPAARPPAAPVAPVKVTTLFVASSQRPTGDV